MTDDRALTLAEVADQLGISRDALRKRCDRGLVAGAFKLDGKWLIPAVSLTGLTDRPTGRDIAVSRPDSHDRSVTEQALITTVEAFTVQLAEKDQQIAELLATIRRLQDVPRELAPPVSSAEASPRPWWRRLF